MTARTRFDDVALSEGNLTLRPLVESDIDAIYRACQDPLILRWLPLPQPYTRDVATEFVASIAPTQLGDGVGITRAIELDLEFVGVVDFKCTNWRVQVSEIGYWVAPWGRGRGAAGRAARLLADWGLHEQGLERIVIHAATGNLASQRAAAAAGFTREGVARSGGLTHAGRVDLVLFSRIRADLG